MSSRIFATLTHSVRYTWSSAGLIMVALPSFYSKAAGNENDTTSGRTQNFVSRARIVHTSTTCGI